MFKGDHHRSLSDSTSLIRKLAWSPGVDSSPCSLPSTSDLTSSFSSHPSLQLPSPKSQQHKPPGWRVRQPSRKCLRFLGVEGVVPASPSLTVWLWGQRRTHLGRASWGPLGPGHRWHCWDHLWHKVTYPPVPAAGRARQAGPQVPDHPSQAQIFLASAWQEGHWLGGGAVGQGKIVGRRLLCPRGLVCSP